MSWCVDIFLLKMCGGLLYLFTNSVRSNPMSKKLCQLLFQSMNRPCPVYLYTLFKNLSRTEVQGDQETYRGLRLRRDVRALARGAAACCMVVTRTPELEGDCIFGEAKGLLRTEKPLGVLVDAWTDALGACGEGDCATGLSLTWYTGIGITGLGLFWCGDFGGLNVQLTQCCCCLLPADRCLS